MEVCAPTVTAFGHAPLARSTVTQLVDLTRAWQEPPTKISAMLGSWLGPSQNMLGLAGICLFLDHLPLVALVNLPNAFTSSDFRCVDKRLVSVTGTDKAVQERAESALRAIVRCVGSLWSWGLSHNAFLCTECAFPWKYCVGRADLPLRQLTVGCHFHAVLFEKRTAARFCETFAIIQSCSVVFQIIILRWALGFTWGMSTYFFA